MTSLLAGWPTTSDVGRFFYILILVVFVALLAYWSTKLIASARVGKLRSGKRNLEVLESIGVGVQAAVQIIRAGEQFFLIGVTKEKISMLKMVKLILSKFISWANARSEIASGKLFTIETISSLVILRSGMSVAFKTAFNFLSGMLVLIRK